MCPYYYSYIGGEIFRRGEIFSPRRNIEKSRRGEKISPRRKNLAVWGGVGGRENSEIGFSPLFPSLPGRPRAAPLDKVKEYTYSSVDCIRSKYA